MSAVSYKRIVIKRREQYAKLLAGLGDLKGGRPLFPELSEYVTPYMLPFIIDNPKKSFAALKERGVPIFRWEDMQKTTCPVSSSYAEKLLQFPCHQEMDEHELAWMIENIQDVLRV
jgi:dTDP-4-amino-4,6-dideoxygalactose transaminase